MKIEVERAESRRGFLVTAVSAGVAAAGCRHESAEVEVSPGEDLMQEHGVIERVLLVYEEVARRIAERRGLEISVVTQAADVVRRFVQDYHEKLEEEFVFPRLEAAKQQVALVATLRRQHQRGCELTDEIARLSSSALDQPRLALLLQGFSRMYRPHAARENTVLFPSFREMLGSHAYRELGEEFEEREHTRLGPHGFGDMVAKIARIEDTLGIGDLASFTA